MYLFGGVSEVAALSVLAAHIATRIVDIYKDRIGTVAVVVKRKCFRYRLKQSPASGLVFMSNCQCGVAVTYVEIIYISPTTTE